MATLRGCRLTDLIWVIGENDEKCAMCRMRFAGVCIRCAGNQWHARRTTELSETRHPFRQRSRLR